MALPTVKEIGELIKLGMTIEAQEKMLEMRGAAVEKEAKNIALKATIQELEQKLKQKEELYFKDQFYWKKDDDTPFCSRCWEKHQAVIHVSPEYSEEWEKRRKCPECSRVYLVAKIPFTPPAQKKHSQYS